MNGADAPHQGRRPRLRRAGLPALALVSIACLAAACGGRSASPGVASLGSTTTTTALATATQNTASPADYSKDVAYAGCMQAHGEPDFPDPNSQGDLLIRGSLGASGGQVNAAMKACQSLFDQFGAIP